MSTVALATACMDRLPATMRRAEARIDQEFYGYRADKWEEIEDSYTAGQAACCGKDKSNNSVRALNLYCKAAQYNHKPSMVEIARLYSHKAGAPVGSPIPYDKPLAYAYYIKAAEDNYETFVAMRDSYATQLTEAERKSGEALAKKWPDVSCSLTE